MSININGIEFSEQYTVLEGLTYIHVYFKNLSASTKTYFQSIQDDLVSFSYQDDGESFMYSNVKIIYLGNNTIYVCGWM